MHIFTVVLSGLLAVAYSPSTATRRSQSIQAVSKRISLHLQDVTLSQALERVSRLAGVRLHTDPSVAPILQYERRTVEVEESDAEGVLTGLLSAGYAFAPLTLAKTVGRAVSGTVYRVVASPVSIDADQEPLYKVVQRVFDETSVNYAFSPDAVGSRLVSLHVQDRPFTRVIESLLQMSEQAGALSLRFDRGAFRIVRRGWQPDRSRCRLTYRFSDLALATAIAALMGAANQRYVTANLNDYRVKVVGEEKPFRTCFEEVLKSANAKANAWPVTLTYRVEQDIYSIGWSYFRDEYVE